ncbi:uncharacterized protein BJ212DRAFT_1536116 [Suillus subaureus]|uniref:DUF6533 domain-containing protein n=1 Tax=Suillus subaureus TaxID=48587 RepID=A0A9P7E0H9_9AGAM|nr:uncharacterized protein BJ212DRAFT_1536116 [Suillus subaureus]KAG1807690.1 hypothetical protein BJ212DRAFT_1536116 [Suillus subaureus]
MVAPIVNTGIQTAKYCNVADLGVLIFDYFLTLEPEVRLTWNRRWNVTRILFIISRYMAFVAAGMTSYGEQLPVSHAAIATRANEDDIEYSARTLARLQMVINVLSSQRFTDFTAAIHIISIVAAEGLLIIRTYVFWKQSKKLLAVLLVLAAISIACAVSITDVVSNLLAAPVDPSDGNLGFKAPPTSNCTFQAGRSSAVQYGFLIAYESLLMSLMVFKRYQDYKDSDSRLVRAVYQGAVRYMTAIICWWSFVQFNMSCVESLLPVVSVVNIVIMSVVPASYNMMMDVPQLVLHSMLASRVLFGLRESDQDESNAGTLQMSTFRPAQRHQYTSFG